MLLGPGLITGASDDDPSGIGTYTTAGASLGFATLWIAILTLPMIAAVQFICAKIGMVSVRGLSGVLRKYYPGWLVYSAISLLVIANTINAGTDIGAIAAAVNLLIPIPAVVLVLPIALAILGLQIWGTYNLIVKIFKWLTLTLFAYVIAAFLARPHWSAVGHALITWTPLPGGLTQGTLLILLSNIGATVTPWMLFFQQSATVDKGLTKRDVRFGRIDTALGAALAATAAIATIVATAPLFAHHMSAENFQAAEFAQALEPVIGRFGAALFALGIVEAGMVACITISTSSAYAFGEVAHRPHSLNLPLHQGKSFYLVLFLCASAAGAIVLIPGLPLVYVVLVVNLIAVLAMPPALVFLFMLANDREIMGDLVTPPLVNVLASGVVIFLTVAGVLFGISVVAPNLFAFIAGK